MLAVRRFVQTGSSARCRIVAAVASRPSRAFRVSVQAGMGQASVKEANELVNAGAAVYLDVRTEGEYLAGHPPGSKFVPIFVAGPGGMMAPNPQFLQQVQALIPDKSQNIMVGCKSGGRSMSACQMLSQAGYTELSNVMGGFDAWAATGLPSEQGPAKQ